MTTHAVCHEWFMELYFVCFIKKTLDVKSTTNTSMIYAETGRFPLASDINLQIIKFLLKILRMENTSHVKLVYNEMFQNPTKHEWIKYVKTLLCSSGLMVHGNSSWCMMKENL